MIKGKRERIITPDIVKFYVLFFISVLVVYRTPRFITNFFFLGILFLFWNSKKDYFWFAFMFIIISYPGRLFEPGLGTDIVGMPIYTIVTGISLSFFDLFFIVAFFKALKKGKKIKWILEKQLMFLFLYLFVMLFLSFAYGVGYDEFTDMIRKLMVFTLFISIPYLIQKREEFYKFIHLVFPVIILVAIFQIMYLSTGEQIKYLVMGISSPPYSDITRLMPGGGVAILLSYIFTLFFIEKRDYNGNKYYLYLIFSISFLSVFLSATRSWIITFGIIFLLYSLFVVKNKSKLVLRFTVIALVMLIAISLTPKLKTSIGYSAERMATVGYLLEGDVTAGGTFKRIDQRLPRVLEGFWKNPLIGWGFSEVYYEYSDSHVGTFNLLLNAGAIGLVLFIMLWFNYVKMVLKTRERLSNKNVLKNSLLVLLVGFAGMMVLQLTQFVFFAYDIHRNIAFFSILFLYFSEFYVKEALKEQDTKVRLK